jgi:hypothetical protein
MTPITTAGTDGDPDQRTLDLIERNQHSADNGFDGWNLYGDRYDLQPGNRKTPLHRKRVNSPSFDTV